MTGIDSWSTTAAENATADGGSINWSEGQAPSTVNNTARQMLADTRSAFNDLVWWQYGTGSQNTSTHLAVPAVYASATSFTIAGADVTAAYHVGRRLRAVGASTGTIYGRITVTSYSPTTTTVTAVWDSGSLSNETLVISLSQIPVTGSPYSTHSLWTPIDSSGAGLVFTGAAGRATKMTNQLVWVSGILTFPVTADVSNITIGGLPYTAINDISTSIDGLYFTQTTTGRNDYIFVTRNATTFGITGPSGSVVTNSFYSLKTFGFSGIYKAST